VEWIASEARRAVVTRDAARDRIMAAVRAEPRPQARRTLWHRVLEPRPIRLSPAASALIAAGLVGVGVIAGVLGHAHGPAFTTGPSRVAVAPIPSRSSSDTIVEFVFFAPHAANVSVVGDFNGWDSTRTPMARASNRSFWTVTLPLTAGRHLYSFVVDGSWSADPNAPLAPDDGFGHANSVKLVRRGSTL
jgi:hypothetical protein